MLFCNCGFDPSVPLRLAFEASRFTKVRWQCLVLISAAVSGEFQLQFKELTSLYAVRRVSALLHCPLWHFCCCLNS